MPLYIYAAYVEKEIQIKEKRTSDIFMGIIKNSLGNFRVINDNDKFCIIIFPEYFMNYNDNTYSLMSHSDFSAIKNTLRSLQPTLNENEMVISCPIAYERKISTTRKNSNDKAGPINSVQTSLLWP